MYEEASNIMIEGLDVIKAFKENKVLKIPVIKPGYIPFNKIKF